MKKFLSMILVIAMALGTFALPAFAAEGANVAKVGETEYATLAEAFAAAGKLGGATVEILKDFDFDSSKAITVTANVTLSGAHTISRGAYAGTMFTVNKGATLTLDGGIVLDGNNNWTFDSVGFYADMAAGKRLATGAKNSYTTSAGTAATTAMISIKGNVVMNNATIQNAWGSTLFSIPAGATLTTNAGSLIKHVRSSTGGSVAGQIKGTWTMNDGKIEDVFGHNTNGGLVDVRGGVVTINGGEITNVRTLGLNSNSNGIIAQVYGETSKLNINGGYIHDNASFAPGNGWGSVVYLNRGGDFTMTGGTIKTTATDHCSAFVANAPTSIELLGGTIEVDPSTVASFDSLIYGNVTVGKDMNIVSTSDALYCMLGDTSYTLDINGKISGTGTMWLMYNQPVTGNGTVTSDVLVKADPSYFEHNGQVTLVGANWNCLITVNTVGSDAYLKVAPGANVTDGLVRVLESVASGDYTNAAESAAGQASSYIEEAGANVTSPVLFYHRLTSAQKSAIVVTYDYNGGKDAQGWSGCQITSAEGFIPVSPAPTREGYFFTGWEYAVENDPESLSMAGSSAYNGELIISSLRLVAKWAKPAEAIVNGKVVYNGELSAGQFTFALLDSQGNQIATTSNDQNGEFTFTVKDVAPGDHFYTVDQIEGTSEEIVYDEAKINVVVTVYEDGTCTSDPEFAVFKNTTVGPAAKKITGMVYLDGVAETADGFTFLLTEKNGSVIATATSVDGYFSFGTFKFDSPGMYKYYIVQDFTEENNGIEYDDKTLEIEIKVSKNGDKYTAKLSVKHASTVSFYNKTVHVHTEETVEGKAPTCTESGLTNGTECSECGETLVPQEEIAAHGHTEETVAGFAPTCTEAGLTDGAKCSVCDATLVPQEEIAAHGHTPGEEVIENVVEATETSDGSYDIVVYCTVCGAELYRETVITKAPEVTTEPEEETTEDPTPLDPTPEETTEPEDTTEAPETTEPEDTTEAPEVTTEPEEEITEEPTPLDPAPETGDSTLIIAIIAIASIALAALYIKRRQVIED